MNEATRHFYLSALGIDVWEARYPLPGAAASVARVVPESSAPPETPVPGADKGAFEPPPVQNLDQIKSVLDDDPEPAQATDEPDNTGLPVQPKAKRSDSTITLRAVFWHGTGLSLAADLGANPGSEIQLRLGTAIMQALGEPGAQPEVIQWPAFENRALPGNDDASFDRLVQGITAPSPSSSWLVLGPDSVENLSPRFRGQSHEIRLSSELTLSRLASDGNAKRELWEMIKHSGLHRPAGNGNGD